MHEIAETRASVRDDKFEEILERVTSAGGEITKDEEAPHYIDIGPEEFELGETREVEFTLNRLEFQLTRIRDTHSLQGEGRQKHVELLASPRIKLTLKKRPAFSEQWEIVDLDDMF